MEGHSPRVHVVTLADVAREAGVGDSTVSRVLRNHGSFSKKTRDRVSEAASRLGYVPNRLAGTLAGSPDSVGSRLVGIVIPSLTNVVFPDLLRGMSGVFDSAGFQSVIGVSDYDAVREEAVISALLSWRPAGLIITGLEHTAATRTRLKASGIRIVEMVDTDGPWIDIVVGFSSREAGSASARHLLSRGYRRIGYVGHDISRDVRAAKRLAGFVATLEETGHSVVDREIVSNASSVAAGRAGFDALMARSPKIDAVYFSNDDMAIGGYYHCLSRGWAVPRRVALFGFNGLDMAMSLPQPMSTIATPRLKMGQIAAEKLSAGGPSETIDVGFDLIEGATA